MFTAIPHTRAEAQTLEHRALQRIICKDVHDGLVLRKTLAVDDVLAERHDIIVSVRGIGRVGGARIDRDREVHTRAVARVDQHAGVLGDLFEEVYILVDVGLNVGIQVRLVDLRKAHAAGEPKGPRRIVDHLELETVARTRANVAILHRQRACSADIPPYSTLVTHNVGIIERVEEARPVLRDRTIDLLGLVVGEVQIQAVLQELHAQAVVDASGNGRLELARVDPHNTARRIERFGKINRGIKPAREMQHRAHRPRDLAALNGIWVVIVLETVARIKRIAVTIGGNARTNGRFQGRADLVTRRVTLAVGQIREVLGWTRPHNPGETVPVEWIIPLVELLHRLEKIVILAHGTQHDKAAFEELCVDRPERIFKLRSVDPLRIATRNIHRPHGLNILRHAGIGVDILDCAQREIGDRAAEIVPVTADADGLQNGRFEEAPLAVVVALRDTQVTVVLIFLAAVNATESIERELRPARVEHVGGSAAHIVVVELPVCPHQRTVAVSLFEMRIGRPVWKHLVNVDVGVVAAAVLLAVDLHARPVQVGGNLEVEITEPLVDRKLDVLESL